MTPTLATSFLRDLIERVAICLRPEIASDCAGQRIAAAGQVAALSRAHETLQTTIGLIGAALAGLQAQGGAHRPPIDGLSQALETFRAKRSSNVSWLDLYCTTTDAIEQINFRSTKALSRLNDDQREVVLTFARAAIDFLEIAYNRDFDAAGMAVICDRLVELGVTSDADAFRVATLGQRFETAALEMAESRARWTAAFEAMASRFEQTHIDHNITPPKRAPARWLGALGRWRLGASPRPALDAVAEIRAD